MRSLKPDHAHYSVGVEAAHGLAERDQQCKRHHGAVLGRAEHTRQHRQKCEGHCGRRDVGHGIDDARAQNVHGSVRGLQAQELA